MDSGRKRYWISMALALLVLAAVLLPKRLEERACNRFAEPLYSHALPADARLVQKSAVKDKSGGYTAAVILAADTTEEALVRFFGDIQYPPAKEGQSVTLAAKPLDENSLAALQKAGLQQAGESYWFVYIYSA